MSKPFRLRAPICQEHPLQKQITDVLRLEIAPPGKVSKNGVCWWSIDHANFAGEVPGARIGRGIIAGIPDFFILFHGRAHHIELKTTEGALSLAQASVASAILVAGGQVGVACTVDDVLACIDQWGIPRNRRVRETGLRA